MGGLSEGALELTSEGHGSFTGQVRLENYGGFTLHPMRYSKLKRQKEQSFECA